MGINFIAPVNVQDPGTAGWIDVDIDSFVSGLGSDVVGVVVHVTASSVNKSMGIRNNGSTDDRKENVGEGAAHCWLWGGCDSSRVFEVYRNTDCTYYLVAYLTSGYTFFTNASVLSPSTMATWVDVDVSSICPDAYAAIVAAYRTPCCCWCGMRPNGSTFNEWSPVRGTYLNGPIKLDASGIFEYYMDENASNIIVNGYYTGSEMDLETNPTTETITADANFHDITTLDSNAVGALYLVRGDINNFAMRKNGSSENLYYRNPTSQTMPVIECDTNKLIEAKLAVSGTVILYLGKFFISGNPYYAYAQMM